MLELNGAAVFDGCVQSFFGVSVNRVFDRLFVEHIKESADGRNRQHKDQNDKREHETRNTRHRRKEHSLRAQQTVSLPHLTKPCALHRIHFEKLLFLRCKYAAIRSPSSHKRGTERLLTLSPWKVRFLWIKSKKIAENTKNEPCTLKNDHEKIAPRCARDS